MVPSKSEALSKVAIVLINLGTPDEPTPKAVRRYLKEFLSDPYVVQIPKLVWWFILNLIILNIRPAQSAEKYAQIWTKEGSPLRFHTERQTKLLQGYLGEKIKSPLRVVYAMRYGNPSIKSVLTALKKEGYTKILILPLYPQYATSTTASVLNQIEQFDKRSKHQVEFKTIKNYHDHPQYIAALAQNIRDYWMVNGRSELLLMSFHGVPRYTIERGDPYYDQCQTTAKLLGKALGLEENKYQICFQSRFGRTEWIRPYVSETLANAAKQGTHKIDIVCPGFVSDCLETLEEIALREKAAFLAAGGQALNYIPCLNEHNQWIHALKDIALSQLNDWVVVADDPRSKIEAEIAWQRTKENSIKPLK